jgi:hypothetical protein
MHNSPPTPQGVEIEIFFCGLNAYYLQLIEVKSLIWPQKGKLYIIYENVMSILGILMIQIHSSTFLHFYT